MIYLINIVGPTAVLVDEGRGEISSNNPPTVMHCYILV